jgi:hypothetical protein
MPTNNPPTELQFATESWLAVLREQGIALVTAAGTDPTLGRCGEALEATRRFVREWDAEDALEKLGAKHKVDLELLRVDGVYVYEVHELGPDGTGSGIGLGDTPAEAVADAERGLS